MNRIFFFFGSVFGFVFISSRCRVVIAATYFFVPINGGAEKGAATLISHCQRRNTGNVDLNVERVENEKWTTIMRTTATERPFRSCLCRFWVSFLHPAFVILYNNNRSRRFIDLT